MLILPHMAQKSNFYDLHGDFISIWRRYAEMHKKTSTEAILWRRVGDSNSRCRSPHTSDLANRPLQPLG